MIAPDHFIRAYSSFALATHVNPEGDAIGSLLATLHLLGRLGKTATAYSQDPVPAAVKFLPGAQEIVHEISRLPSPEAVIVLDCGELSRTGPEFKDFALSRPLLNIDHHQTNDRFGTVNWVDPAASSTGELIGLLIRELAAPLTPEIAACLYLAILTDTGSFQFSNTTARALQVAADMVAAGADPARAADRYYHARPASHLLLVSQCLATLEFNADFTRGELVITLEMLRRAGTGPEAAEGMINTLTDVETVRVAVLYRELKPGEWKVSFRSKGDLDVAALAARFDGGGHRNAAGGRVRGTLEEVKRIIRPAVAELFASG